MTLLQRAKRWRAFKLPRGQFWFFFVGAVFFNFGFSIFFLLFNLYLYDLGRTERSLGAIGSFMAVGSILGTIPVGIIAQRFGLRVTLTGGILLAVVFSVLRTCILRQPAQLILAAFTGFALCTWAVCLSPAVASLTTRRERPVAFSLIFASGIGVGGFGAFIAGRLPGWLRGSRHSPLSSTHPVAAALLFACAVATLALLPISRLKLRSAAPRAELPRLSNPFLLRFLPAMAVWNLVTGSFAPFANIYFVHHFGLSLQRVGFVFSVSHLVQFAAVLSAPLLFRRTGLGSGIMLTQLATAAALVSLASTRTAVPAECVYWIYMGVQYMNEPGIYSLLMDRIPAGERNGASASTFFVNGASQAIASAAMGAAILRFGYSAALSVIGALAVVAAVLFRRLPQGPLLQAGPSP